MTCRYVGCTKKFEISSRRHQRILLIEKFYTIDKDTRYLNPPSGINNIVYTFYSIKHKIQVSVCLSFYLFVCHNNNSQMVCSSNVTFAHVTLASVSWSTTFEFKFSTPRFAREWNNEMMKNDRIQCEFHSFWGCYVSLPLDSLSTSRAGRGEDNDPIAIRVHYS